MKIEVLGTGCAKCNKLYQTAVEAVAEAGHADGLEIELATADDAHRPAFAQVYKEMAAQAGITVNINMLPSSAFWDQWQEWPFSVSGWNGRIPATISPSLALRCGSVESGWGETYYCNEEFERIGGDRYRPVTSSKGKKSFAHRSVLKFQRYRRDILTLHTGVEAGNRLKRCHPPREPGGPQPPS